MAMIVGSMLVRIARMAALAISGQTATANTSVFGADIAAWIVIGVLCAALLWQSYKQFLEVQTINPVLIAMWLGLPLGATFA